MHRTKVRIVEDALDANNTIARANREDFDRHDVAVVNLMSAPGSGKTTLLERGLANLDGVRVGVLEGDVQGSFDADRLAHLHIPVTQLNTDSGFGGECHLDANMVRSALGAVPLADIDLLVIENVGNLVCPAEFDVGEDARVMVCSVAEGEDKPMKYPLMFRRCELVLDQQDRPAAPPRLRPRPVPLLPRPGASGRGAHAHQRSHRRGSGGLARVASGDRRPRAGARVSDTALSGCGTRTRSRAARRARRGERAILPDRGRAPGPRMPPDGRALCPRRTARRAWPLARRPV